MHLPLNEDAVAALVARPVGYRQAIIDGKPADALSGRRRTVISPIDESTIAEIPDYDTSDVELAVQAARRAWRG